MSTILYNMLQYCSVLYNMKYLIVMHWFSDEVHWQWTAASQRRLARRRQPRAARNSPIWQFEDPISTCNSMITMKVLVIRRASANSPSQPHVLGEDCNALGVDGAQQRVFEKLNNKSLRCFLECQQGLCLKTDIALEILAEFSHQTLKWPHP